jgi:glycine/D-amino acid oxidase-like deaminating enzyme
VVELGTDERLKCKHIVVATGAWAGELTGLPLEPRKGQLVAMAAPANLIRHKLIEDRYRDVATRSDPTLGIATVIEQTLDGDEVVVGSSRERVGFDTVVREEITHSLIERAATFVPRLRDLTVLRAWCGFRPWLPDGLPAIGMVGERLWVTTGHEGSGVGLGPISGLLLSQLITGETPVHDPSPFDPRRFEAASRSHGSRR